ncbi:MAG: AI-2E family transporter, partial [Chloroflexia bacterium]
DVNFVELGERTREGLRGLLERWRTIPLGGTQVDLSPLVDPALEALGETGSVPVIPPPGSWLPKLGRWLSGFASTVTSAFVAFFLTLLYSFYMVKDAPRWGPGLDRLVPEAYREEFRELRRRLAGVWRSFFRGQLVLCLVIAAITFVVLTALGIPGAIPLALLAGLMEVVPNLGPFLALVPAALVALLQGSMWLPLPNFWVGVIVVGAYVLIQQVENNFLAPRIVGGSIDLPPLVVLVGVVVGVSSAGLVGAYLSGPILASLKVLALYAYNKVLDRPPFPELRPGAEEEAVLPVFAEPLPQGKSARRRKGKRSVRTAS